MPTDVPEVLRRQGERAREGFEGRVSRDDYTCATSIALWASWLSHLADPPTLLAVLTGQVRPWPAMRKVGEAELASRKGRGASCLMVSAYSPSTWYSDPTCALGRCIRLCVGHECEPRQGVKARRPRAMVEQVR